MMIMALRGTDKNSLPCFKNSVFDWCLDVRNVLVIVALRQKDSLRDFSSENYMQIVKCAKDLLSSLYDKVVLSKGDENPTQFEG